MKIKLKEKPSFMGKYRFITFKNGKEIRRTDWIPNLIVLNEGHGLNLIIKQLLGDTTYGIEITKAKIGDDDTAVTDNDTDLGNTIVDNIVVASRYETSDAIATIVFFITDAELPDGTYKEFGVFVGNQMFARSIISPNYTKATGEDTRVEYVITAANS